MNSYKLNYLSLEDNLTKSNWEGAVVCCLWQDHIVFIRRSLTHRSHRGQVAFFGGMRKEGESFLQTAQREFEEETGLNSSILNPLGTLPLSRPSSGIGIIPVVFELQASENELNQLQCNEEWDELFSVPISYLSHVSNWTSGSFHRQQSIYRVYFCGLNKKYIRQHWGKEFSTPPVLWGATASMVFQLLHS